MARNNRGQNHYLGKYEKLWSSSREESKGKDHAYKFEPARKRPKRSTVFETCIEDLPQSMKDYAI